jgi:precorrin-6Y C5,15-methyltransferase (decarboxylating)
MRPSSGLAHAPANTNPDRRWLAVVGIGEDGIDGLGAAARRRIAAAEIVFGGPRHLAPAEMDVLPAASAFALAAARLGWPLHDVETVALHARPIAALRPLLHPGARILALTADGAAPAAIAALLVADGFGASTIHVLEALGGPAETHRTAEARAFGDTSCAALNLVAIEVAAAPDARILPLAPGLADERFQHDGQITKREIRALALAALAPRRGEMLWDIGAGAGSVAIEWLLCHPSLRAVAIEARPDRAARIADNATALGVPALRVVEGAAPAALDGLPPPDAIFLGGGGTDAGVLDAARSALRPGGRLVAHAVTLEMQAVRLTAHARDGGDLVTLALSRAAPLGGMTGWQPARPVTQWTWVKP